MSVVNRMLQDIDQRLGSRGLEALPPFPEVRSVAQPPRRSAREPLGVRGIVASFFLALAAAGIWWGATRDGKSTQALVAPSRPPAAAASAPTVVAPAAVATAPLTPAAPPTELAPAAATSHDDGIALVAAAAEPSGAARAALPSSAPSSPTLKLSALLAEVPVAPSAKNAPSATSATGATSATKAPATRGKAEAPQREAIAFRGKAEAPVRQVAAAETVAAARSLWSEGARGAALATLREALSAAEASQGASVTIELARELARLEIADNRAQVALDVLRRLEGTVGVDADAWALRGNAEQRLALHHEAAASYLTALRLNPEEPRWMLGAAISLAAEGKMDEARAWVERGRERGAITPTIAAYLQQLGLGSGPARQP